HPIDERLDLDAPLRDQLEVRLHVPVLGPANVAERVIVAVHFVRRVVAAGSVRRAHQEIDLLPVEHVALHLQADVADNDYDAFGPRDLHRQVDHGVGLGCGGDEGTIDTASAGGIAYQRLQRIGIAGAIREPSARRALDAFGIEIEADYVA